MPALLRSTTRSRRRAFTIALLCAVASLAAPSGAGADERPKWELGIGSVFYTQPDYVGSDEYRFHPIPFPWLVYRGPRLRVDRESMQTKIFGTDFVRLDLSASGQISVNSSENDRRHGMHDLDWMLQLGPALRFPVMHSSDGRHTLDVEVPLRVALAISTSNFSYEGLVASPKLQYRYEPDGWRFEANAGLEFSNNDYNDYIYGVTPRYATPTRRAYDAHGGYGGVRIAAGVNRYFGPFYVGLFTRYINTSGAAFGNSPLVATSNAFIGGIAIGWVWMKSDEMVPVGAEANLAAWHETTPRESPEAPTGGESERARPANADTPPAAAEAKGAASAMPGTKAAPASPAAAPVGAR